MLASGGYPWTVIRVEDRNASAMTPESKGIAKWPRKRRGHGVRLVFARQQDDVVGEIERDFIQREVGECDPLGENDGAVAIVAREQGSVVGDDQFPHLKFLF
jgi:hypothetical protein